MAVYLEKAIPKVSDFTVFFHASLSLLNNANINTDNMTHLSFDTLTLTTTGAL